MKELQVKGTQEFMGIEIPVIEGGFGEGKRCILVKDVANIHGVEVKFLNRKIRENIEEFEKDIDLLEILEVLKQHQELSEKLDVPQEALNRANEMYLLSESGYMALCSLLRTDKAREIRKQFRREYFSMREQVIAMSKYIELQERELELQNETIRLNRQNILLIEDSRKDKRKIANLKKENRDLKQEIDDMTASGVNYNTSCAIPARLLKRDIKAFMKDFTEEKSDIFTDKRELYEAYCYTRRGRDEQPGKAQFEQILIEFGYMMNHSQWFNLKFNRSKIRR